MGIRRMWRAAWRRWWALLLAGGALLALGARAPASLRAAQLFPAHSPAALAHILADFSKQPHVTSWSVEEDRSNYTTWSYAVSFSCGARCAGRALVHAHDAPLSAGPRHGHAARAHSVTVALQTCTGLPIVAWPQLCEEVESRAVVTAAEAARGARLVLELRSRCSLPGWLSGACARALQHRRDVTLASLRDAPSKEVESRAVVTAAEAARGARLVLELRSRCSLPGWLSGACARALQHRRDVTLASLRDAPSSV